MKKALSASLCAALTLAGVLFASPDGRTAEKRLNDVLEPVRRAHDLPALGGAVVTLKGLEAVGAAGIRKVGFDVPVTAADEWHIGSDAKAMTAAMIGALVERGKLRWETTFAEVFPDAAAAMSPEWRTVTLLHLLSHRSGLPANILWGLVPRTKTTRDQRLAVIKGLASVKFAAEPGAAYLYSNLGYVIAAAMAEKASGATWEDLMRTLLFEPLRMRNVGFGGLGTPGRIDQPWPHGEDGRPIATNGPDMDNPPVMGPAGRIHLPLGDWAKFVADQLRGARGEKALLKPETYKRLQTPPFGGDYALGWMTVDREWGGGKVLTHSGSNTMNYAVAWLAPARGFAVLVVCNQGGPVAAKACDEAASELIRRHEGKEK